MKDQHDNKTVDWVRSKHAVRQGEKMILVLRRMIAKTGRTSVKEVNEWIGGTARPARTFVEQLELAGYVAGDKQNPEGFKPTEKAKQLFGANP
ncbi:hypothetical protein F939_02298 [Acinetobacter radioresistens DSM 6976 = NBRC 102413 = CIP 103788]|uniref:hypothetical protein n=1 Tax=Acinetobacter radioresistens TaxID=40216 RepID=UPI0002CFFA13|nr:hypothetical protein [Acinetobacter radioresistens]ENV87514.1 hypothetical protein F939_02298 [Acinetobacter radioresistens DSM 6976 = NBRC 102413 = CIP 103788]